jgi:transglutaminase-like putative cysteine protease
VDNHRGTSLFKLGDLGSGAGAGISLSYLVEVYAIESAVRSQQIRTGSRASPIENAFTLPSPFIPSKDPAVVKQASALCGREQNPYIKARRIYEWLIAEGGIQAEPLQDSPGGGEPVLEALENRRADPYLASLLFCALARAAGVPAIPAAGVLVDRLSAARRHYWAEFWIEGFGWIPLDPALGAGAAPPSFSLREDAAAYYFGNLDNQRIAFSRGQTVLSPMDPRGRTAARNRDYALQNLWEEASGGLESYSSLWSDVTISGIYAQ